MGKIKMNRPEAVYKLCTDMGMRVEWEALDEQLRKIRSQTTGDRLTGNVEATRLAEQIRELEDQMQAGEISFRLKALPRPAWNRLTAEHPPRQGDEDDKAAGFNRETFFDALMTFKLPGGSPGTILEVRTHDGELVEFDPEADWSELADEMTNQQYSDIANLAHLMNEGRVSVPFSRAASRTTETSETT
jgi:hypothetical protein